MRLSCYRYSQLFAILFAWASLAVARTYLQIFACAAVVTRGCDNELVSGPTEVVFAPEDTGTYTSTQCTYGTSLTLSSSSLPSGSSSSSAVLGTVIVIESAKFTSAAGGAVFVLAPSLVLGVGSSLTVRGCTVVSADAQSVFSGVLASSAHSQIHVGLGLVPAPPSPPMISVLGMSTDGVLSFSGLRMGHGSRLLVQDVELLRDDAGDEGRFSIEAEGFWCEGCLVTFSNLSSTKANVYFSDALPDGSTDLVAFDNSGGNGTECSFSSESQLESNESSSPSCSTVIGNMRFLDKSILKRVYFASLSHMNLTFTNMTMSSVEFQGADFLYLSVVLDSVTAEMVAYIDFDFDKLCFHCSLVVKDSKLTGGYWTAAIVVFGFFFAEGSIMHVLRSYFVLTEEAIAEYSASGLLYIYAGGVERSTEFLFADNVFDCREATGAACTSIQVNAAQTPSFPSLHIKNNTFLNWDPPAFDISVTIPIAVILEIAGGTVVYDKNNRVPNLSIARFYFGFDSGPHHVHIANHKLSELDIGPAIASYADPEAEQLPQLGHGLIIEHTQVYGPLTVDVRAGDRETTGLREEGAGVSSCTANGGTPLHLAASSRESDIAPALIVGHCNRY